MKLDSNIEDPLSIVNVNPEEVQDYKYVSIEELQDMMMLPTNNNNSNNNLLWSPWFIGIMERGGFDWWKDINNTLNGKYTNTDITFFNPPIEHYATFNENPLHNRNTGVLSTKRKA